MFILHVRFCDGKAGEIRLAESQAFDAWATYADLLLTGEPVPMKVPGVADDAHADQVTLLWEAPLDQTDVTQVAAVFLVCPHKAHVTEERATSKLLLPN